MHLASVGWSFRVACYVDRVWSCKGFTSVILLGWLLIIGPIAVGRGTVLTVNLRAVKLSAWALGLNVLLWLDRSLFKGSSTVKPAEMAHELLVGHIAQLGVILQSRFYWLSFCWANAYILHLAVLDKLTILPILELYYLMYVCWGWGCSKLRLPIVLATVAWF